MNNDNQITNNEYLTETPEEVMYLYSSYQLERGAKRYELANHLGNVLTVISDKKTANFTGTTFTNFTAERISATDYSPFGAPLAGRTWNGGEYRFGFNGKEKDDETYGDGNAYDFGARIHSSRLGQFLSIDPLTKKYPYWSPYLFAGNNPIRFIDVNGEGPGDLFKSIDEAASDFGKSYNDNSIVNKREYGIAIIRVKKHGEVFYTYATPVRGFAGSVLPPSPLFRKKVAYAHTHSEGDGEGSYNGFSAGDYEYADFKNKPLYVATPDGSLLKYDPKKSYKYGENQYDVVNTEQPSDPVEGKHRKNNIDATSSSLPKNEPSRRTRIIQLLFIKVLKKEN